MKNFELLEAAIAAVTAGMKVIDPRQISGHGTQIDTIKDDATTVTLTDKASEHAILEILNKRTPRIAIHSEEAGTLGQPTSPQKWLVDPLDGTNAFSLGLPTSTVIVALYDQHQKQLTMTVIGEPSTGRLWFTLKGTGSQRTDLKTCHEHQIRVWNGDLNMKATVFVDISHGFTRDSRQILTNKESGNLLSRLAQTCKTLLPGSNGLNHALVSNGGEGMAGAITTAIGGPFDIAGVLLVLEAGGCAAAFRITDQHTLEAVDPLDVFASDILISANSPKTLDSLIKIFRESTRL